MTAPALILGSTSPFRRELLNQLSLPFEVAAPNIDETALPGETPAELVERLAIAKARAVAESHPHSLVIGSDQVAVHGTEIVGKPRDHAHAVEQLQRASGTTVVLHTGVALVNAATGAVQSDVVPYAVVFRELELAEIEAYLEREQPYGCAGSLKAEALGVALLERHVGDDPSALIGLPLIRLTRMLRAEGLDPLKS